MSAQSPSALSGWTPQGLNPKLLWALGLTLLLCAWAWWWPAMPTTYSGNAPSPTAPASLPPSSQTAPAAQAEPVRALTPATTDPFALPVAPPSAPVQAAVRPAPLAAVVTPQPALAAPPPRPVMPPPTVFGRVKTPEGQWLVFLKDGNQVFEAKPQLSLPSGYQVTELSDSGITLSAKDSGEVLQLTWPTP